MLQRIFMENSTKHTRKNKEANCIICKEQPCLVVVVDNSQRQSMTHNHTMVDLEMQENHKLHTPVHNHNELHSTDLEMLEVEPSVQVSPTKIK